MIQGLRKHGLDGGLRPGIVTRAQRIAQGHGDVALPALMADAPNRAAQGVVQEFRFAPGPQRQQLRTTQTGTLVKIGQRAALCKFVPGAHQLAVITAVNPVAHERAQFQRNGPGVLDGEVRDAASRIQLKGCHDGLRGADGDARAALAAVAADGLTWRQSHIQENFAQKKQGARVAVEHQGVFAAPTQTAAASQLGFQHWCRVGEHPVAERPDVLRHTFTELLQALAQDLVIIPPPGINGDHGFLRALQATQFLRLPIQGGI